MQRFRRFLIEWGYIGIALLVIGQLLTPLWWGFTLLTPFTFIGSVLLLAIVPLIWPHRLTRRIFLSVGFLGVVWGALPLSAWQQSLSDKTATTIISYNVNIDNANINNELSTLQNSKADLLFLAEAGGRWQTARQQLRIHYPYGCGYNENSPFALHALSRLPLLSCNVLLIEDKPFIRIQLNDQRVIYFLHPPPPLNAVLAKGRQDYLFDTAKQISKEKYPIIIIGDLNITPFSPLYRQFYRRAKLQSAMPNYLPTWRLLHLFYLPIDRVLSRLPNEQHISVNVQSWSGSDHRPIRVLWQK